MMMMMMMMNRMFDRTSGPLLDTDSHNVCNICTIISRVDYSPTALLFSKERLVRNFPAISAPSKPLLHLENPQNLLATSMPHSPYCVAHISPALFSSFTLKVNADCSLQSHIYHLSTSNADTQTHCSTSLWRLTLNC